MLHRFVRGGLIVLSAATMALGSLLTGAHVASAAPATQSWAGPTLAPSSWAGPTAARTWAGPTAAPVAVGTGSKALESQRSRLAATTGVAAAVVLCWNDVTIKRWGLNLYVTTEKDFSGSRNGELRARATSIGTWEQYTVCRNQDTEATNFVAKANGLAVAAEIGYGGSQYAMLRARTKTDALGPWELFRTDTNPFQGYCTQIQANANGLFVAAEENYTTDKNMLRARTAGSGIGSWETFCW